MNHYNLVVLGAGSAGVRSARLAANLNKKVALIENYKLGGTCVNRGCIPKKILMYASSFTRDFIDAKNYGFSIDKPNFNWQVLLQNMTQEIDRLNNIYDKILSYDNLDVLYGTGSFIDKNSIQINDKTITFDKAIIATGAKPFIPNIKGNEFIKTSNDVFLLDKLPKKITLVGGGFIALELASIFAALDVETHLIYRGQHLLKNIDKTLSNFLHEELSKSITIHMEEEILAITKKDQLICHLKSQKTHTTDYIVYATGRVPNTDQLNLKNANILLDEAFIKTNKNFETTQKNIYALGDVKKGIQLTPVAIKEAVYLIDYLYNKKQAFINYDLIASCVFSYPQVASIGPSEEQLQEQNISYDVYQSIFTPMKNTIAKRTDKSFMKMLVCQETNVVLSLMMAGDNAAEIIQGFAVALQNKTTKEVFDQTIAIHPTSAEEFVLMSQKKN